MAVQRALKLIYKYALIKKTILNSINTGSMVRIEGQAPADGYSNIFSDPGRLVLELRENDSNVVESPEFQDQIASMMIGSLLSPSSILAPLHQAFGSSLNSMGSILGISRHPGEKDKSLRGRMKTMLSPPTGYSIGGSAAKDGY